MRSSSFSRLVAVPLAALVVAAAAGCGSSSPSKGTTGPATTTGLTTTVPARQSLPSIHLRYPAGWAPLPKSRWASVGASKNAAAVLERKGNSANLVVVRGPEQQVNDRAAQKLNDELKARYSDYEKISAQVVQLPNGGTPLRAMLFAYERVQQGVFHTVTVIPAGKISFIVYTASPPKSKAIAREISRILKSARLTDPTQ
jgi:hypothetical protein